MSDWNRAGYDDDGDPLQSGLQHFGHYGITMRPGPVLGVVLAVHAADDNQNLLLRTLRGSTGVVDRASYAEADVLILQSHVEENFILPHCLIAQMKSSRVGPNEDEPADFTEDLPNGCTAEELDALYNYLEQGQNVSASDLSGDWVFVDFLGGVLQMPLVRGWFSNPFNFEDAAPSEEKRRFRFRRNNSGFTIEHNGDWNWYHRDGQYLQFKDKGITLKHVEGAVIHMDKDGSVNITNQAGHTVRMDADGILASTGSASVELKETGNINIVNTGGNVNVSAQSVNLVGSRVVASDGEGGGSSIAKATTVSSVKIALDGLIALLLGLSVVAVAFPPLKAVIDAILVPLQQESAAIANAPEDYQTAVLRGE